jgi:hypothetical protein
VYCLLGNDGTKSSEQIKLLQPWMELEYVVVSFLQYLLFHFNRVHVVGTSTQLSIIYASRNQNVRVLYIYI